MNTIIKKEVRKNYRGLDLLFHNVVQSDTGMILNQKAGMSRPHPEGTITVNLRFDDGCKNGHESFAITGDISKDHNLISGGCIHDEIAEYFPALEPLIKWHLTSTDGPMHYIANTCYHARDRDYRGHRKGEPNAWEYYLKVAGSPVLTRLSPKVVDLVEKANSLTVYEIPHPRGEFTPKYAFEECKWHEATWDSQKVAESIASAINDLTYEILKLPTRFSEGKERELDHARRSAVWPEATDEELCADDLKEKLEARLPQLLKDFRRDMEEVGFIWPKGLIRGNL